MVRLKIRLKKLATCKIETNVWERIDIEPVEFLCDGFDPEHEKHTRPAHLARFIELRRPQLDIHLGHVTLSTRGKIPPNGLNLLVVNG
jgi:hypothetical protein